ncbi:DciA family protein [Pseudorhodoferax sp.]|uniref:DciA family protein n=1 Tax=Pseudorhodoferax sp. TaxID=1993553 RepID=UPI002DD64E95|nr:DciA family protein [Pseudorhodoferax sp.]
MQAPRRSFTLQQAVADSAPLARLSSLVRESSERLAAVQQLIPAPLRPAIRPGPIDEQGWCLLVDNSAAAAKLRHLAPLLQAALRNRGWDVAAIRVKIQKRL